jgi:hypothetical protein
LEWIVIALIARVDHHLVALTRLDAARGSGVRRLCAAHGKPRVAWSALDALDGW